MGIEIEKMLEEVKDGDLVELTLKENNVPRLKERFVRGNYIRITIGLEKLSIRPGYGSGESNLISSVLGYYGQWFREGFTTKEHQVIIYPMSLENVDIINSSPPIRIDIPLREIKSYKLIKKGERPVTPPSGFP